MDYGLQVLVNIELLIYGMYVSMQYRYDVCVYVRGTGDMFSQGSENILAHTSLFPTKYSSQYLIHYI